MRYGIPKEEGAHPNCFVSKTPPNKSLQRTQPQRGIMIGVAQLRR